MSKSSFLGKADPWALGVKHPVAFVITGEGGTPPTFTANTVTLTYDGGANLSSYLVGSASYSGNQLTSPSIEVPTTATPGDYKLTMTGTYDGGQVHSWFIIISFYKP